MAKRKNPIILADFPDPDVIRVSNTYYMVSTTMHFFPGAVILKSDDLLHWEIASYVFDSLDGTDSQRLEGEQNIYGKGMWAASLRYEDGIFYVWFSAYDTGKTYIFTSKDPEGSWQRREINRTFHHGSLLFDEDGRKYVVWGMRQIHITELESDLSGVKEGGLDRIICEENHEVYLGYEGSHVHKVNGTYYVFLIHWTRYEPQRRTHVAFWSDSLTGEFVGQDVLSDDMGMYNQGVAQGGIVETPEGEWYAVLQQEYGAAGRFPVLVPMHFEDKVPVFGVEGKIPAELSIDMEGKRKKSKNLMFDSNFFDNGEGQEKILSKVWQWNHEPNNKLWSPDDSNGIRLKTDKISVNLVHAANTLTQRTMYPKSQVQVHLDASELHNGDNAGLCVLQGCYGWVGITKEVGRYYLVMWARKFEDTGLNEITPDYLPGTELYRVPLSSDQVDLMVKVSYAHDNDTAEFCYKDGDNWVKVGENKLFFKLDHFMGARYGLFVYSTSEMGGQAHFTDFNYKV